MLSIVWNSLVETVGDGTWQLQGPRGQRPGSKDPIVLVLVDPFIEFSHTVTTQNVQTLEAPHPAVQSC